MGRFNAEAEAEFGQVLGQLSEPYRRVLWLSEMESLTPRQIAAVMDFSEATVVLLLRRARQQFKVIYLSGELANGLALAAPETAGLSA